MGSPRGSSVLRGVRSLSRLKGRVGTWYQDVGLQRWVTKGFGGIVFALVVLALLGLGGCAPGTEALFCRSGMGELDSGELDRMPGASAEVCVLDLRRSAKNFWEYRATIEWRSAAGDRTQRQWILDCRADRRRRPGEPWRSLRPTGIGSQACQLGS
ncbi:MAG: hypothetical protein ACO4AI_07940 [Prochlorothrix sp.]|nr:hypothetical protein [Prochlorothrix sp.]